MINNLINDYDNHWIPAPGYQYVSDGVVWTDSIYLGTMDSIERWHGTNDEPPEPEDEPTVEDKAEAFVILMGVED